MNQVITDKREAIIELCEKYKVSRLEVFGSAATDLFDPETSDVDFLVTFGELKFGERADAYFGLLFDLEKLFGRHVDLVAEKAIDNPYFMQEIQKTRTLIYAA